MIQITLDLLIFMNEAMPDYRETRTKKTMTSADDQPLIANKAVSITKAEGGGPAILTASGRGYNAEKILGQVLIL